MSTLEPLGNGPVAEIAALVRAHTGLVVDASRREVLAGVVRTRVAQLGLTDPQAYLARLENDPAERQLLTEDLTIGETYFARIPPQIRALEELVLPALLARPVPRLRIWSAGCSTGEEPYTLALLLAKVLPATGRTYDIRIIGTDINSGALRTARTGRYGARSVGLLADEDLQRFFDRDGDSWLVGDELRAMVEFRHHNLVADPPPEPQLDLVLCRNVLIYFDRPRMLGVVDAMHRALGPDGWLLLGHSETLWRVHEGFGLVRHEDAFLYRRLAPTALPPAVAVRRAVRAPAPTRLPAAPPNVRQEIRRGLQSGEFAMAAKLAMTELVDDPLAAEVHYLHGLALVELGEDAAALVVLRRAAYLDPTFGCTHFLLGLVLGRLGHPMEAARAYRTAAGSLSHRRPDDRVAELGGRRIGDLAQMCHQLAAGPGPARPAFLHEERTPSR